MKNSAPPTSNVWQRLQQRRWRQYAKMMNFGFPSGVPVSPVPNGPRVVE